MTNKTIATRRSFLLAAVTGITLAAHAQADEIRTLTAAEITDLLTGNTTIGLWSGTPYRQHFYPTGQTTYIAQGGRPEYGRWRVNAATNKYESEWARPGAWSAYGIAQQGDQYLWVEFDGSMQPFTVQAATTP